MLIIILIFLEVTGVQLLAQDDLYPLAPEVWSEPIRIEAVSKIYSWDDSPSLTKNLDTMYFEDNTSVVMSVKVDGVWQEPVKLSSNVNDGAVIRHPMISRDGKRLYTSAWGGYGSWDLWLNIWNPAINDWNKPVNMGPVINSSTMDYYLYEISPDSIYTITYQWASGPAFYVRDSLSGEWKLVDNFLYNPITAGNVEGLSITVDKKKLYYATRLWNWSDSEIRNFELCVCYWDSSKNNWGDPYFLNINSKCIIDSSYYPPLIYGGGDMNPWISADGRTLFFSSDRYDGQIKRRDYKNDIYYSKLLINEHGDTITTFKEENGRYYAKTFKLYQNYPNPFNSRTTIEYELEVAENIRLIVYDVRGSLVATLVKKRESPGRHRVYFDASYYHLASGLYIVALQGERFNQFKKMIYVK